MTTLVILVIGFVLWILTIYLVRKWKYFWIFFATNLLIIAIYTAYLTYGDLNFIGHDEYGLPRLMVLVATPLLHVLISFIIAIIVSYRLKKITIANKP